MAFDDKARSSSFFKPGDYANAKAILIEVKQHAPKSQNNFGETKDAVYADLTVFRTEADLAEGGRPKVFHNERVENSLLYRELIENVGVGNETVRTLAKWEKSTKAEAQKPWVWRYVDADTREKVIEWYDRREAAVKALSEDADVPEFLK